MTADLVVDGGTVVGVPARSTRAAGGCSAQLAVVVDGGRIVDLVPAGTAPAARYRIDATGLWVLPGLVDIHVHFDEPGRADWEGWAAGSLAAAAGGVTTVVDMPIDADPPTVDLPAVRAKLDAATGQSLVDFGLWGGLVPGRLDQLGPMADAGVVGFKAFACDSGWAAFPPVDRPTLAGGLAEARQLGVPVALHAEDPEVLADDPSRPAAAEVVAVRWASALALEAGARLHIAHLSSADTLAEVAGNPLVSAETCPHYLLLDQDEAASIGPLALVAPPIRDRANQDRLWQAVSDGTIAAIVSDHSPCPPAMKAADPPFAGIAAVETGLSSLLASDRLPVPLLIERMTAGARLLDLPGKGCIDVGADADLVLVDPAARCVLDPTTLHSRHRQSPFAGRLLVGRVVRTIVRGRTVFADGQQVGEAAGRFVRPAGGPRRP